nr:SusC/RagA family TonB-linked outer membrane protein [Gemmatimonadaceae bacterium]
AIQDYNLSASGGTPNATFLISGGYTSQQGAIIRTGFERFSVRVNSEARRGRFTVGEALALSRTSREGLSGFPLIDAVRMLPTIPVRDPANPGGYGFGSDANPTFGTNPVGAQESRPARQGSNQVIGTLYGEANYDDFGRNVFTSRAQVRFRTDVPFATLTDYSSSFTSLLLENLLTYDDVYRDGRHRITAVAGLTEQRQTVDTLSAYREGFVNEGLRTIDAGAVANQRNAGGTVRSALRGFVARANYVFGDRYILSGSFRRDASSRFGPGNRYANFGAGSAAWVISEEGFYKGSRLASGMDFLKLRASTGVLGNQDIGDFQFAGVIQPNLNYLLGSGTVAGGATQLSLANPNIRWQSNRQTNIGLDLGFLRSSLTFTVDWYESRSSGLLVAAPLPWSLGASGNPVVNAGAVRNRGLEFGAQHRVTRGNWQVNTTANLTTIDNRVLSLGNGGQPIFDNLGIARTAVGGRIGEFFVLQTAGIFQDSAAVAAWGVQPNARPGDLRFVDRNNDGLISLDDRYNAGNGLPRVTGGLFVDVRYRNLDVGLNLRGQGGNRIFNAVRWWTDRGDDPSNFRTDYTPWTPENPTNTPRIVAGPAGAQNAELRSDRWIERGDFLRIQNLVVGYTLPERFARFVGSRTARPRVYLNIQNLHTFTRFTNWDPEVLGFGNPLGRGIDDGAIYPNVRTVTVGFDYRM